MNDRPYSLAIETSSRRASITLGRGDELLAASNLASRRRHSVGLMPGIGTLCHDHRVTPTQIGEVHVSLGPGSFTGLRVGVAAAKMFALAQGVRLVGVPTLEVLAARTLTNPRQLQGKAGANPPPGSSAAQEARAGAPPGAGPIECVAVCLNAKRGEAYCAAYRRGEHRPKAIVEPRLRTLQELLALAPRPLTIVAEKLPTAFDNPPPAVSVLPPSFATPSSEALWRLGRQRARAGRHTAPAELLPLYIREPEAVTQWNQRYGGDGQGTDTMDR